MAVLRLYTDSGANVQGATASGRKFRRFDDLERMGLTATDGSGTDVDRDICHLALVQCAGSDDVIIEIHRLALL